MSNSLLASSPATRKKNAISPSLIQPRSVSEMPVSPTRIESTFVQKSSYESPPAFAQTSASSTAASRTIEPPDSVRRKSRIGRPRLRAQAVRPDIGCAAVATGQ